MKKYAIMLFCCCLSSGLKAQTEQMSQLMESVKTLRKATKAVRNSAVMELSGDGRPKLTLMDDIKRSEGEYRGSGANRFMMNQIVAFVYDRQNTRLVTKGDFFNSQEKGVYFSAIEKTVRRGSTVTYQLTGHRGPQEFAFIPFGRNAKYEVTVEGGRAKSCGDGVTYVELDAVVPTDVVTFTIRLSAQHPAESESFVIINHNPQR